jgi:hypothetical protein
MFEMALKDGVGIGIGIEHFTSSEGHAIALFHETFRLRRESGIKYC